MPVAQGGPPPLRQAVVVGLGAVLGVAAVLFLVTQMDRLIGGADLDIEIGDGIYRPGEAEQLAEAIAGNEPLLLPDLSGGDRDLWLNSTGEADDPDGWHAIAARQPTAPRRCTVAWQPDDRTFVDACDDAVYPETGEGLPRYPVSIDDDGQLLIDLNRAPSDAESKDDSDATDTDTDTDTDSDDATDGVDASKGSS